MKITAQYVGYNPSLEKLLQPVKAGDRFDVCPAWELVTPEQLTSIAAQWGCSVEELKSPAHASAFVGWPDQRHVRVLTFEVAAPDALTFATSLKAQGLEVTSDLGELS